MHIWVGIGTGLGLGQSGAQNDKLSEWMTISICVVKSAVNALQDAKASSNAMESAGMGNWSTEELNRGKQPWGQRDGNVEWM